MQELLWHKRVTNFPKRETCKRAACVCKQPPILQCQSTEATWHAGVRGLSELADEEELRPLPRGGNGGSNASGRTDRHKGAKEGHLPRAGTYLVGYPIQDRPCLRRNGLNPFRAPKHAPVLFPSKLSLRTGFQLRWR